MHSNDKSLVNLPKALLQHYSTGRLTQCDLKMCSSNHVSQSTMTNYTSKNHDISDISCVCKHSCQIRHWTKFIKSPCMNLFSIGFNMDHFV